MLSGYMTGPGACGNMHRRQVKPNMVMLTAVPGSNLIWHGSSILASRSNGSKEPEARPSLTGTGVIQGGGPDISTTNHSSAARILHDAEPATAVTGMPFQSSATATTVNTRKVSAGANIPNE